MIVVLSDLENCRASPTRGLDRGSSVGSRFLAIAQTYADHPAVITRSQTYSYGMLASAALRLASFLAGRSDFAPGCRVALIAGNAPEYVAALYGIVLARGVVVPLPTGLQPDLLNEVLTDCDARLLLTGPRALGQLRTVSDAAIAQLDLAAEPFAHPNHLADATDGAREAMILYTSGSTGKPKGVLLSHGNLLANAESIIDFLSIRQSDRALSLLPFCHAYGNSVLQTHVLAGAALILEGSTTFPNSIVDALEQYEASSFAGVPEMYSALLACSDLGVRRLPHLRYMTVAGAALAPEAAVEIADRISPAKFYVMYGQTEATARLAYLPPDDLRHRPRSIGKAIPGVELQVQSHDGRPVTAGETGELCARGPNVMLGYWRHAAETALALKDGWLHTGDLAHMDEEGFFYVQGRRQEQVKIRGLKVVPSAIAEVLSRRLAQRAVAVVPYEFHDATRLALFVANHQHEPIATDQVQRICVETLSRHQLPSHVEILDKLPLTAALKVDLTALSQRAAREAKSRFVPAVAQAAGMTLANEERG